MIPEDLTEEAPYMQGRILLAAMERVCGRRKDLGRMQVRQLQELFSLPDGSRTDLPYFAAETAAATPATPPPATITS